MGCKRVSKNPQAAENVLCLVKSFLCAVLLLLLEPTQLMGFG